MGRLLATVVVLAAGVVIGAAVGALRAAEFVIVRPAPGTDLDPTWRCPDYIPEGLS